MARAMLVVGPLAVALVLGIAPRSERTLVAHDAGGIDTMTTGSISPSSFAFSVGRPGAADSCLRFPDGSQRGPC